MSLNKRFYEIEKNIVNLKPIKPIGRILDIGGGGEGIIGQLLGNSVVSIDIRADELMEAPKGPLKIVMDADDLKFLDDTFDMATSFFTFMYIEKTKQRNVLKEVYRVLKPEGELLLWDVTIPIFPGGIKDIFLVPLEIHLPEKNIFTKYGVQWKNRQQSMAYYVGLAEEIGFKIIDFNESDKVFFIKIRK